MFDLKHSQLLHKSKVIQDMPDQLTIILFLFSILLNLYKRYTTNLNLEENTKGYFGNFVIQFQ